MIDEVENHLHPQWQRTIVPSLLNALQALHSGLQVQVLLTTHAPMVLASIEPDFKPELDKLFLFKQEDKTVLLEESHLLESRRGDAANWLTSPLFGMEEARSRPAERAILAAEALMRGDSAQLPDDLATVEKIHQELLRTLPDQDRFWTRWIIRLKRSDI